MFLTLEISNIGVTREMENLDSLGLLSIMDGHVAEHVDILVSTVVVTQINGTLVIIPKVGGKLHIWHVLVSKKMAERLGSYCAFIGRVNYRFTGAVTDTCLMEDTPGKRATSAGAEVVKEGTKCVEGDDSVSTLCCGGILGTPVGIGVCREGRIIPRPTKSGGR